VAQTIANGGVRMEPRSCEGRRPDGRTSTSRAEEAERVMSPRRAATLTR
jgi:cell division protein FtsI/penicillin-binding protein 2